MEFFELSAIFYFITLKGYGLIEKLLYVLNSLYKISIIISKLIFLLYEVLCNSQKFQT